MHVNQSINRFAAERGPLPAKIEALQVEDAYRSVPADQHGHLRHGVRGRRPRGAAGVPAGVGRTPVHGAVMPCERMPSPPPASAAMRNRWPRTDLCDVGGDVVSPSGAPWSGRSPVSTLGGGLRGPRPLDGRPLLCAPDASRAGGRRVESFLPWLAPSARTRTGACIRYSCRTRRRSHDQAATSSSRCPSER